MLTCTRFLVSTSVMSRHTTYLWTFGGPYCCLYVRRKSLVSGYGSLSLAVDAADGVFNTASNAQASHTTANSPPTLFRTSHLASLMKHDAFKIASKQGYFCVQPYHLEPKDMP